MRYIRYFCIALFGLAMIAVALANREIVALKVLPAEVAGNFAVNPTIQLPLFLVILGSILIGLLLGLVWEWVREFGQRSEAAKQARELRRMQRKVDKLKSEKHEGQDDVLALLDEAS